MIFFSLNYNEAVKNLEFDSKRARKSSFLSLNDLKIVKNKN